MAIELLGYALTCDEMTPGWAWLMKNTKIIYQRKDKTMETTEVQWAIMELMGHQQIAGRYQEAAGGMHRIDVPDTTEDAGPEAFRFTRLYSPAAIYSITFVDEQSARLAARMLSPRAITVFGFESELKRLAAPAQQTEVLEHGLTGRGLGARFDGPEYYEDDFAEDDEED